MNGITPRTVKENEELVNRDQQIIHIECDIG